MFRLSPPRISTVELSFFTRQLALMIRAGLPLRRAMETFLKQPISPSLRSEITTIIRDIEAGKSFSESLTRNCRSFDGFYIAMVRTGEAAGILDQTLSRLADGIDAEIDLQQKVKSAFVYPAVMLMVAAAVIGIMTAFVLPRFETLFSEMNAQLPLLTEVVLSVSRGLFDWWWIVVLGFSGTGFLVWNLWSRTFLKHRIRLLVWKIPMVSRLLVPVEMARFARGISLLDEGGVPVAIALRVSSEALGSRRYRNAVHEALEHLENGTALSVSFEKTKIFPEIVVQMMGVGEQTGAISRVMSDLASYYEKQVDYSLARVTALIEPAMIVILSAVVGFIVIAMLLPIFQLSQTVAA